MALEIRDIIHDIVSQVDSKGEEFHSNFKDLVQWNRNLKYLKNLKDDCDDFRKAISIMTDAERIRLDRESAA
jgi:hypothetical protein